MARPEPVSSITSQRDFSAGEVDVAAKRDDTNPIVKAGARQMANWRILNSRTVQNRPGRRALIVEAGAAAGLRTEEVTLSPGNTFKLAFTAAGALHIYDGSGNLVASQTGLPWAAATLGKIVWARLDLAIYIAFPAMTPRLMTWDGATTWTFTTYAETVTSGNQKRTLFYRISPKGVSMLPSATTGNITLNFSAGMNLVAGHVGTRMRFCGRQILITGVTPPTAATATVEESLPPGQSLSVTPDPRFLFSLGDVIQGSSSGAKGVVAVLSATNVTVQLLTSNTSSSTVATGSHEDASGTSPVIPGFALSETVVGPGGSAVIASGAGSVATTVPQLCNVWDDEVMNAFRGYPQSVFVDQGRLGFCNFPALPAAIAWSAIASPADFYIDAFANSAIFELVPDKSQVLFVAPGPEGSEFVFCDQRIFYIPINETNPLKPGSVAFNQLAGGGALANVQPRLVEDTILYARAGGKSIGGVVATGAYKRPYETRSLSELHAHLISNPVAIAIQTADATFEERYAYVLNADGSVAVGKYTTENGQIKGVIGWLPWTSNATVRWISGFGADILFSTTYPSAGTNALIETLDDAQYLDMVMSPNAPAAALLSTLGPAGTNIGDMTANGGLAAAFDGTRVRAQATSADKAAADGYVGRNLTTAAVVWCAAVWPASDNGFVTGGAGANILLELRGKATAPANSTDGTLLGSTSITAANNPLTGPVMLTSNDHITLWQYVWLHVAQAGATGVIAAQFQIVHNPLWFLAGGSVDLIDQVTRMRGTYAVDAVGGLIANTPGEDFTQSTLVAGQAWTATLEPFIPAAQAGQDAEQRLWPRRLRRVQAYVINASGFVMARLYGGQSGPNLPAAGTIMKKRRITTWNQDDDPSVAPTLREQSYLDRPLGRAHDPRWALIKDTPGPIQVAEISCEVSV